MQHLTINRTTLLTGMCFALFLAVAQAQSSSAQTPEFRSDAWFLADTDSLGFVAVPAGSFPMGSNPLIDPMAFENERWSESRRQGIVDLPLYYVSRFETTVGQYRAFVEATGYNADAQSLQQEDSAPVTFVSWTDAIAYTRWLDGVLRTMPDLPQALQQFMAEGGRVTLPNEAEWEKAAKGEEGRIYPWGNQFQSGMANVQSGGVKAVGSIVCPECVYGLSDMSGNVWEWTRSPYRDYPFESTLEGVNLREDALWVMRGGSFNDDANNARAAVRGAADPGARRAFIGFRVVLSRE